MLITADNREDQEIIKRVYDAGQEQVFRYWPELNAISRQKLLAQLLDIDFQQLTELYQRFIKNPQPPDVRGRLEPADFIPLPQSSSEYQTFERAKLVGETTLRKGRVAAFVVAGGQATRLGFNGPKGAFPISPIKEKSFFQLFAEQIVALSKKYHSVIPWYIMTSKTNHCATVDFFEAKNFFGLNREDVMFFQQGMMPALDENGKLILDAQDHIFTNPNGHGGSLSALKISGALQDLRTRGIDLLFYFQVDNVLIKICDPVFIGFHVQNRAQMSSKILSKRDAQEKVGVLVNVDGRLSVIEYSDMSDAEKRATNTDGTLKYRAGNIAIHLFDLDFIEEETLGKFRLPWHVAHKKIPYLNEKGHPVEPERPNGYKFEKFVFDALMDAERTVILEVRREKEFSAVKNARGTDSPQTARRDLVNLYGTWLEKAGVAVPRDVHGNVIGRIEISPLFALTADDLAQNLPPRLTFDRELYLGQT
jgi:UDP-N-acetylglucosamine/UDP-N-acetylgalactosamine diphosphorylase